MNFYLIYLLESTLALGLVWLVYKLVLEHLTFFSWSRTYLLLGLVLAFILPGLNIPLLLESDLPAQTWNGLLPAAGFVDSEISPELINTNSFGFSGLLVLGYLAISGVMIFRLGYSVFLLLSQIRKSRKIYFSGAKIAVNEAFSPSSFFSWVLLPESHLNSEGIHQIVKHESMHVAQGHSWDLMVLQVIKGLFWINPFLYLLEKSLKEVHEFEADSGVIEAFEPIAYSRLLVQSISVSQSNFIPSFNQFQTKKRIIMMNKPKSSRMDKARFLVGIPLLCALVFLFSCQIGGGEKDIQGEWTGSDFQFEQTSGPEIPGVVEGGKSLHIGGKLNLNQDMSYVISDAQGTINGRGTWMLAGDVLKMTDDQENVVEYQVVSISDKELVTKHEASLETPMGILAGTIQLTYNK